MIHLVITIQTFFFCRLKHTSVISMAFLSVKKLCLGNLLRCHLLNPCYLLWLLQGITGIRFSGGDKCYIKTQVKARLPDVDSLNKESMTFQLVGSSYLAL